jgi:hypothetical protein
MNHDPYVRKGELADDCTQWHGEGEITEMKYGDSLEFCGRRCKYRQGRRPVSPLPTRAFYVRTDGFNCFFALQHDARDHRHDSLIARCGFRAAAMAESENGIGERWCITCSLVNRRWADTRYAMVSAYMRLRNRRALRCIKHHADRRVRRYSEVVLSSLN